MFKTIRQCDRLTLTSDVGGSKKISPFTHIRACIAKFVWVIRTVDVYQTKIISLWRLNLGKLTHRLNL